MTIDTLIQTVSDKNKTITLNSVDKLVLKKSTTPDEIISENMTDDFDVYSLNFDGSRKEKIITYKNDKGYTAFSVNDYSYANDVRSLSFEIVRK